MTFEEAIEQGYYIYDSKYSRGYVSRKTDILKQPVKVAGGRRKGELYIEEPCYCTTNYFLRSYLKKRIIKNEVLQNNL